MNNLLNRLQTQNKIAIQVAFAIFLVHFTTFLLYVCTGDRDYGILGIFFLVIASIFTVILFLIVLGNTLFGTVSIKEGLFTLYILMLNAPITFLYFYINYKLL